MNKVAALFSFSHLQVFFFLNFVENVSFALMGEKMEEISWLLLGQCFFP